MQKKIVWLLAVPLLCVLACTVLTARAGAKESISLSADGSEAEVTLEVPQEMVNEGERVVSLQLSFQVDAKQGSVGAGDVSFEFNEEIGSAVKEERYDPKSGVLNIYISGGHNLYSGTNIPLGKVVLKSGSGSGSTATVRVVPNSLKTINAAHGTREQGVNAPGTATLVTGDGGQANVPETPKGPDETAGNQGGGLTGGVVGNYTGNVTLGSESQNGGNTSQGVQRPIHVSGSQESGGTESLSPGETGNASGGPDEEAAHPEQELPEGVSGVEKKLYAIEMDVWTKIFVGMMAAAVLVIVGISAALLLGRPKKRKSVRRGAAGDPWEEIPERKPASKRPPAKRPPARRLPEETRERKRPAKPRTEGIPERRSQTKRPLREETVVSRHKKSASMVRHAPESGSGQQIAWKQNGKAPQRRRRRTDSQGASRTARR